MVSVVPKSANNLLIQLEDGMIKKITVVHKKRTTGYIIPRLQGDACVNNGCKEKDPGP